MISSEVTDFVGRTADHDGPKGRRNRRCRPAVRRNAPIRSETLQFAPIRSNSLQLAPNGADSRGIIFPAKPYARGLYRFSPLGRAVFKAPAVPLYELTG
jgi:hypothetical protein